MPDASYKRLLWDMSWAADLNPDSGAGEVNLNTLERVRFTNHLQQATRQMWYPQNREMAWPETLDGKLVTLDGKRVALSLLGDGDCWSFWTEDPRPDFDPHCPERTLCKRLLTRSDGTYVYPNTTAAQVWVFYRRRVPQWTATLVDTARVYNSGTVGDSWAWTPTDPTVGDVKIRLPTGEPDFDTGDMVRLPVVVGPAPNLFSNIIYFLTEVDEDGDGWFCSLATESGGVPIEVVGSSTTGGEIQRIDPPSVVNNTLVFDELGTGNVYKAIAAHALGSDLEDTAKWEPQLLPERLVLMVQLLAEAYRQRAKGEYKDASVFENNALNEKDLESIRLLARVDSLAPWCNAKSLY